MLFECPLFLWSFPRQQKKMGRPSAETQAQQAFNWAGVEEVQQAGKRKESSIEEVPLCLDDFIRYYTQDAPSYQRCFSEKRSMVFLCLVMPLFLVMPCAVCYGNSGIFLLFDDGCSFLHRNAEILRLCVWPVAIDNLWHCPGPGAYGIIKQAAIIVSGPRAGKHI